MKKKQYIQPSIKKHIPLLERHLMQQGSEQTSNPWDWNSKKGFMDEEENEPDVWGKVDW